MQLNCIKTWCKSHAPDRCSRWWWHRLMCIQALKLEAAIAAEHCGVRQTRLHKWELNALFLWRRLCRQRRKTCIAAYRVGLWCGERTPFPRAEMQASCMLLKKFWKCKEEVLCYYKFTRWLLADSQNWKKLTKVFSSSHLFFFFLTWFKFLTYFFIAVWKADCWK